MGVPSPTETKLATGGSHAVCLVTDANYLLPTVVAAIQAREAVTVPGAAVIILAMGLPAEMAARYGDICAANNVELVLVTREVLGDADNNAFIDAFFSGSTFTFGALGRLFLDQMVDPKYTQLLYMDGDIQIPGSLNALLSVEMEPGTFLAAPDPKSLLIYEDTPSAEANRQYMAGLGLAKEEYGHYFNSGVLRISRDGWREAGLAAFDYLRGHSALCICHDQSALNAASRNARRPMSIKWNYPPYFRYYDLEARLSPKVVHFMSHPKPWNGAFEPWGKTGHKPYLDFVAEHPASKPDLRLFLGKSRAKYLLLQNYKRVDEFLHAARRQKLTDAALAYEKSVVC